MKINMHNVSIKLPRDQIKVRRPRNLIKIITHRSKVSVHFTEKRVLQTIAITSIDLVNEGHMFFSKKA